ncbi:hypothetical protein J3E69DRAFT_236657 [Trichoderma sp. SZMC 28015]
MPGSKDDGHGMIWMDLPLKSTLPTQIEKPHSYTLHTLYIHIQSFQSPPPSWRPLSFPFFFLFLAGRCHKNAIGPFSLP